MKIILNFKAPFIVGGNKIDPNYIETMDYIQGNVIRASFAKKILMNCPLYEPNIEVVVKGVKRKHWVYIRDGEKCDSCLYKNICKDFSKIKFSYFYPKHCKVVPLTAMKCKIHDNHPFIDCLIEERKCPKCNSRVEYLGGFIRDNKLYNVKKSIHTKTSIDSYTKTTVNGKLYTLLAVAATEENSENIYEGHIEGISPKDMELFKELRIGSYTSIGFGKAAIEFKKEEEITFDKEALLSFDKRYKENNFCDKSKNYAAIKFISDCKLDIKRNIDNYMETDQYRELWKEILALKDMKVEKVYTEIFNYRGFNTSKENLREEVEIMGRKGSVVVLSSHFKVEEIYKILSSIDGFGKDIENGFGQFTIYCGEV